MASCNNDNVHAGNNHMNERSQNNFFFCNMYRCSPKTLLSCLMRDDLDVNFQILHAPYNIVAYALEAGDKCMIFRPFHYSIADIPPCRLPSQNCEQKNETDVRPFHPIRLLLGGIAGASSLTGLFAGLLQTLPHSCKTVNCK